MLLPPPPYFADAATPVPLLFRRCYAAFRFDDYAATPLSFRCRHARAMLAAFDAAAAMPLLISFLMPAAADFAAMPMLS